MLHLASRFHLRIFVAGALRRVERDLGTRLLSAYLQFLCGRLSLFRSRAAAHRTLSRVLNEDKNILSRSNARFKPPVGAGSLTSSAMDPLPASPVTTMFTSRRVDAPILEDTSPA